MFTVIIAEKETIKLFNESCMFFGSLFDKEKVAFCEWKRNAESFDVMLDGIYDLIEFKKEWRALIFNNDNVGVLNPFNYTDYSVNLGVKNSEESNEYKNRREYRFSVYEKAALNPLVKLSVALCGKDDGFRAVISDTAVYNSVISGETDLYEYMLYAALHAGNCIEAAARLDKYQRESLRKFVNEEQADSVISFVKNTDAKQLFQIIQKQQIPEFIKLFCNDPSFYDPEYTECMLDNTKKSILLNQLRAKYCMKDKLPTEIICVSPRCFDNSGIAQDSKWENKDENSYSRFADYNLYGDKLRFILFDVSPSDNRQYKLDSIKLLCFLLILANNELPRGIVNSKFVYRAEIDFSTSEIKRICENYIGKLEATKLRINDIEAEMTYKSDTSVDNRTARRLFESDLIVPVKINSDNKKSELFATHKGIGLASDRPEDENDYWSRQYREINKSFIRYLREPRRAVKQAVSEDFRENNSIDDDRALLLTENQAEDIRTRLNEKEQAMVETVTCGLFDTVTFTQRIHEANDDIKKEIEKRMTAKKIIAACLTALAVYGIGFLPLFITGLNGIKSFSFSLILFAASLAVFAAAGIIYLFVQRARLVEKIKHFNEVMNNICGEISTSLSQFSKYLSCACDVMRSFSILRTKDSKLSKASKIFRFHRLKIDERIKTVHELFSKYVELNANGQKDCKPFEFDFTVMRDYEYEMPDIHSEKNIEFMQSGNYVSVPVEYVESLAVMREELYD